MNYKCMLLDLKISSVLSKVSNDEIKKRIVSNDIQFLFDHCPSVILLKSPEVTIMLVIDDDSSKIDNLLDPMKLFFFYSLL